MRLHWHRRDLRVRDAAGLAAATDEAVAAPVFVFDPDVLEFAAPPRVALLLDALAALRREYRERGSDLLVARGDPSAVLPTLAEEYDAEAVTWAEDHSGLARERDRAVDAALGDAGVDARPVQDLAMYAPGAITTTKGEHYSVFTYYWKKWRDREKPSPYDAPAADRVADVSGEALPDPADLGFERPDADLPDVTPAAGRDRLNDFCEGPIYDYAADRDYPAREGTARLSHHLKFGTVGIRTAYEATEEAMAEAPESTEGGVGSSSGESGDDEPTPRGSVEEFQRQLAWRDFYLQVLADRPDTVSESFEEYANPIEWREDEAELRAWQRGETGYPIVDAGMRQLLAEGFVHNRVRMLVAAFLTKDLLIDWRRGYEWFRAHLADHDPASDAGGWQWAASTGTDAQPYFRVFNPVTQGERYDPDGAYVREHVPELTDATADEIHGWTGLSPAERERVAPEYPAPIADHAERRETAIAAFERARGDD